jgi:GYF domain 2
VQEAIMTQVKILPHVLDVARAGSDRWYVTNGATSVGPINLDLLARGVEAGKVPVESFVRHEAWKVWRPLGELAEITDDEGRPMVGRSSTDDISVSGLRPSMPQDFLPSDAVAGAVDRRDALLLLLAAAVARGHAEVAMIHELNNDGAVAVSAHGPQVFEALGMRTKLLDPALIAAAAGMLVLAEPAPGVAGQAIIDRLSRLGLPITGAVMLPIRPRGRLYGTIELGRRSPFRAIEVAGLEALVDALVFKLEALA